MQGLSRLGGYFSIHLVTRSPRQALWAEGWHGSATAPSGRRGPAPFLFRLHRFKHVAAILKVASRSKYGCRSSRHHTHILNKTKEAEGKGRQAHASSCAPFRQLPQGQDWGSQMMAPWQEPCHVTTSGYKRSRKTLSSSFLKPAFC